MLSNFYLYILQFGYSVWNGIVQLGSLFSFSSNISNMTFSQVLQSIGQSWYIIYSQNPFYSVLYDFMGSSSFTTFNTIISSIMTIPSLIVNAILSVFTIIMGIFHINFTISSWFMLIVYFIIALGFPFLLIRIMSKIARTIKDLINIYN